MIPPAGESSKDHRWWSDTPDGTGKVYHKTSLVDKSTVLYAIFANKIDSSDDFTNISCGDDEAFYYLTNNLVFLAESNICPDIGFSGVLDGAGKSVFSFVTSSNSGSIPQRGIGIFGKIENASIFNLNVHSEVSVIYSQGESFTNFGLLTGTLTNSTLENIYITSDLNISNDNDQSDIVKQNIGLLAGTISMSELDNVSVSGKIDADILSGYPLNVGGVAGSVDHSELKDIYTNLKLNIRAINSQVSVGGVAGILDNGSLIVNSSVINDETNIISNYINFGGIVGFINRESFIYDAEVTYIDRVLIDSYAMSGDLSLNIGGAVGRAVNQSYVQYASSENVLIDINTSDIYEVQSVNIGGLIGRAEKMYVSQSSAHIKSVSNSWFGTASTGNISIGGLIGKLIIVSDDLVGNFIINDSYAAVDIIKQERQMLPTVSERSYIGGLIGFIEGEVNGSLAYNISRVHTYITSLNINDDNAYVGGVFGYMDTNIKQSILSSIISGSTTLNHSKAKRAIGNEVSSELKMEIFSNKDMLINGATVADSLVNGVGIFMPQGEQFYIDEGWDFDNVWTLPSVEGAQLPIHKLRIK